MRFVRILALTALASAGGACGGGSNTNANHDAVSVPIKAAAGGMVAVGGAGLNIPGGSLASDVTITASAQTPDASLPEHDSIQGMQYDFGPSGTTFNPPATLTLPSVGSVPANRSAVVSWFDGSKWNDLPTTVSANGVSAPVSHFTSFVVRWVIAGDGAAVDCSALKAPCGGDLVGTWKPSTICPPPSTAMFGNCADSMVTYAVTLGGSVTFTADLKETVEITQTVHGTLHATPSCLATNNVANCADGQALLRTTTDDNFATLWANAICTGDGATSGCDCVGDTTEPGVSDSGTYTLSGTGFISATTNSGGKPGNPTPYCVDGNTLWIQTNGNPVENLALTK